MTRLFFPLAALCCLFELALAGGATYDWTAKGLSGNRVAEFRLWVPEGAGFIREIIVLVPGRNGDGRDQAGDPEWQALATRWSSAILACRLTGDSYYIARTWSGQILLQALEDFALQCGHAELPKAALAFWGYSAGGQFSCSFVDWKPDQVMAFAANKGNFKEWKLTAAGCQIPGLWVVGEKDAESIREAMTTSFSQGRRLGAPWVFAVQPGVGHEIGNAKALARVPQFERADAVMMRICGFFHVIFGTTFSINLDWRGI